MAARASMMISHSLNKRVVIREVKANRKTLLQPKPVPIVEAQSTQQVFTPLVELLPRAHFTSIQLRVVSSIYQDFNVIYSFLPFPSLVC